LESPAAPSPALRAEHWKDTRRANAERWKYCALILIVAGLLANRGVAQTSPNAGLPSSAPVPDVAAFLQDHPAVAGAIICQFPHVTLNYKDWTPAQKKYLLTAFARAWRGEPSGLPDPLPNAFALRDDERVRQGLSEQDALQFYFTSIAWSLALEMQRTVSWSILDYTQDELAVLFDSRQMFQLVTSPKGTKGPAIYEINPVVCGTSLPAPPEVSIAFVLRHHFFGANQLGTVGHLLGWCEGLSHFTGNDMTANMRAQWHYDGFPPESRVISGTTYDDGKGKKSPDVVEHFTAGCHGTTGFLRSVLRSINIPVENVHAAGHSLPYFPTLDVCLTHGDDIYNQLFRSEQPALLPKTLFIDPERYDQLFGPKVSAKDIKAHVGIRPHELALEHLPLALLNHYLEDQRQKKSHTDGEVAKVFAAEQTVAQLEAQNLWSRMDALILKMGGAEKVGELNAQLLKSTTNRVAE
jgi:hypothetical protein